MGVIRNFRLNVKKFAAMTFSGVLTLACCGCGDEPIKIPGAVISVDDSSNVDETTIPDDTSVLEEDGTTVYYVTDELGETSYLETTDTTISDVIDDKTDVAVSDTTYTTAETVDTTDATEQTTTNRFDDTTAYRETTTYPMNTTGRDTTYRTTDTTSRRTTESTKQTTESTKRTTESTTKTTEKENHSSYVLSDIKNNYGAFSGFCYNFSHELMKSDAFVTGCRLSYGVTSGCDECALILYSLNEEYISDDIIKSFFSDCSQDELQNYKIFLYKFNKIQEMFESNVDFTKYCLDPEIGKYLNRINSEYRNGNFDSFMEDQIVNGNIKDKFYNNAAIMAIMHSYDSRPYYLTESDINYNCMDGFFDRVSNIVYGNSYTK